MTDSFDAGHEIIRCSKDVFSTMLMVELEVEDGAEQKKAEIQSNISSLIGLGGDVQGLLAVHCPLTVATAITSTFLGMDIEEIDDDVKDAIGEVANMVAGNLKRSFAAVDVKIDLAIPTSVVGDSFHVCGAAGSIRCIVPFGMGEQIFWVELMYIMNT